MRLIRYKEDGVMRIKAKNNSAMFKHCSGGVESVTEEVYETEVRSVLLAHDVCSLGIESDKSALN